LQTPQVIPTICRRQPVAADAANIVPLDRADAAADNAEVADTADAINTFFVTVDADDIDCFQMFPFPVAAPLIGELASVVISPLSLSVSWDRHGATHRCDSILPPTVGETVTVLYRRHFFLL
jgi:hypothetical protein